MLYIALAVAAVLLGADQLTKFLIESNMLCSETVPVIAFGDTEVFNITYVRNTGAAFSIMEGRQTLLSVMTVVIIAAMLIFLLTKKVKNVGCIWSMALVISGGLGNLIDRLVRGYVVDFIDLRIIHFAIFNVADICAVLGAFGLLLFVILDEVGKSKEAKAKKAEKAASADTAEKSAEEPLPEEADG